MIVGIFLMSFTSFIGMNPSIAQDEDIVLTFWWTEGTTEGALYETLIADFEAANPGITVNDTQVGYFDQPGQWNTAYTAGNAPDVLRADVTWITTWAYENKLVEIPTSKITDYADFTDESIEKTLWNGKIYGIPQVVDGLGMFYNAHFLEEAGVTVTEEGFQTFDAFTAAGAKLNTWADANYDALNLGTQTSDDFAPFNMQGYSYAFLPILYGFGGEYFENNVVSNATKAFDSQAWTDALTFLKSILPGGSKAMTPPVTDQGWGNIDSFFTSGKVSMIFMGPWAVSGYLGSGPMFNKTAYEAVYGGTAPSWVGPDNLQFMKVPKGEAQGIHSGGHAYVVSKKSENQEAAMKLADFLASKKAAYLRARENSLVSPHKSTYTSDFDTSDSYVPADDRVVQGFRLNLDTGITRPVHPYWIPIDNLVAPNLEEFRAGNLTVQQAIDEIMLDVSDYFEVNGELSGGAGAIPGRATPGFEALYMIVTLLSIGTVVSMRKRK